MSRAVEAAPRASRQGLLHPWSGGVILVDWLLFGKLYHGRLDVVALSHWSIGRTALAWAGDVEWWANPVCEIGVNGPPTSRLAERASQ